MHGDMHVRFGGGFLKTYHRNVARRRVPTLLDFCFKYNGANYNYPTIIFYQLTYELAVMWQASRRHYRLNQRQECHTYYMATEGTLQQAAVQIMAEKQVAASAIQGKFSVDGLVSMAKGIDPRLKMAQMLANGDNGADRQSLENMFDVMNASNNSSDDKYADYVPPKTFYEVMDGAEMYVEKSQTVTPLITEIKTVVVPVTPKAVEIVAEKAEETKSVFELQSQTSTSGFVSFLDLIGDVKPIVYNTELTDFVKPTKRKVKKVEGQLSLFDLVA